MKVVVGGCEISFFPKPKKGYGEVAAFLKAVNPHSYAEVTEKEIRQIFLAAYAKVFAYHGQTLVGCGAVTEPTDSEQKHCPMGVEWMVRAVAVSVKGLGFYLWQRLLDELTRNASAPSHPSQAHRSVYLYTGRRQDFWRKVGFKPYKQCDKYCWMRTSLCILPESLPK